MKTLKMKGFTIIELLAVIVVLALIMILTVPNIMKSRDNALKGIGNFEKKSIRSAGESLGIDIEDYMSDVYNCNSSSWLGVARKYCTKDESGEEICVDLECVKDEKGKWLSTKVSLDDLIKHGYYDDKNAHCRGVVTIGKTSSGYDVDLNEVSCK